MYNSNNRLYDHMKFIINFIIILKIADILKVFGIYKFIINYLETHKKFKIFLILFKSIIKIIFIILLLYHSRNSDS